MSLFTATGLDSYARCRMPLPKYGDGPWGEAIRFWLIDHNMRQADLLRAIRETDHALWEAESAERKKAGLKPKKLKEMTKNSVSNAYRGLHTTTRTLEKIAYALKLPLDMVLVSPARRGSNEERLRLASEAARIALREDDERRGLPTAAMLSARTESMYRIANDIVRQDQDAAQAEAQPKPKPQHEKREIQKIKFGLEK